MGPGYISLFSYQRAAGIAVSHSGSLLDFLLNKIFPGPTADLSQQFSGHGKHQIAVSISCSERVSRFDEAYPVQNLLSGQGGGGPEHQISGSQAKTTAVTEKVFDHHFSGHIRVRHHEFREIINHPAIPADFTFIHQCAQSYGCKELAVGGNAEQALSINRGWLAELFDSITFSQQDLTIFDDG